VLVGGQTSVFADVRSALNRDYSVVFPVAALMIALILGIVAAQLDRADIAADRRRARFRGDSGRLGCVFQGIEGNVGVSFFLPLMVYLFVIAMAPTTTS